MIIDTHCHLIMEQFHHDMDDVIKTAMKGGVGIMNSICTTIAEFPQIMELCEKYQSIYGSVGVHPDKIACDGVPTVEQLIELSKNNKIVAFGETGLDYVEVDNSIQALQCKAFENHISAGHVSDLPLVIHSRSADQDMLEMLEYHMNYTPFRGVIHCFTGDREFARKVLDLGLYISFSGIVTFKNAATIQDAAQYVPLDRILVETDAPFLAPVPMRGKRNEPFFVHYVVEFLSHHLQSKLEKIQNQADRTTSLYSILSTITTQNAYDLFKY